MSPCLSLSIGPGAPSGYSGGGVFLRGTVKGVRPPDDKVNVSVRKGLLGGWIDLPTTAVRRAREVRTEVRVPLKVSRLVGTTYY